MWFIGKASRRRKRAHCRFARATRGGFPQSCGRGLSGGPMLVSGAHGSRCPAPPRHALLAESLGKPSLWAIINEVLYQDFIGC